MEYIRNQPYIVAPTPYPAPAPGITVPTGYSITVTTTAYVDPVTGTPYPEAEIQKNTVTVSRDGKNLVTVEDLKALR